MLVLHWIWPFALLPSTVARVTGVVVLVLSGWLVRSAEVAMRGVVRREERYLAVKFGEPIALIGPGTRLGVDLRPLEG